MSVDITVRWGGPSDASASSTYKIERTLNYTDWSELDAAQAATSPYISPNSTLSTAADYAASSLLVVAGTDFSNTGYGYVNGEALVQWTGKSTNELTGVTWHSGYGSYAIGVTVVECHESYLDSAVEPSANAVCYRITHTDASSKSSAPSYLWYYYPPTPASSGHCVVVAVAGDDIGVTRQASVSSYAYLATDDQYDDAFGAHLDAGDATSNATTTNAMGLAFFQCWKNSARRSSADEDSAYYISIGGHVATVSTIPDRDWILLSQVEDA